MVITVAYEPRRWAEVFHASVKRWFVLVLHRRAGKTTAVLNHLQRDCIRVPGSQYAYIAPTQRQARMIAWDIAKKICRDIPGVKTNEQNLTITYPNGSKILLLGSENVDSLRGLALWGGAQDEASQQPSNLFSEVISKCLADHLGYWIWLGTPKGKNEFYRVYMAAGTSSDWTVIFRTIDDSLKEETGPTIENLRQALEDDRRLVAQGLMTEDEFNQEWYCSFEAAIKGSYYSKEIAKARAENRIKLVPYDPSLKVHMVSDLGVGPRFATGFYQRSGSELRMIDFWEGVETDGIPQAVKAAKDKPYVYGKWFLPHDAQANSIDTGKTRVQTIKGLWPSIEIEIIPKLSVDDGINKGKLMFAREWFDEKHCQVFLDYIVQYRQVWDDNRGMFLETPYHDFTSHAADVHRGAAVIEELMTNETIKPYQQPPNEPASIYGG